MSRHGCHKYQPEPPNLCSILAKKETKKKTNLQNNPIPAHYAYCFRHPPPRKNPNRKTCGCRSQPFVTKEIREKPGPSDRKPFLFQPHPQSHSCKSKPPPHILFENSQRGYRSYPPPLDSTRINPGWERNICWSGGGLGLGQLGSPKMGRYGRREWD